MGAIIEHYDRGKLKEKCREDPTGKSYAWRRGETGLSSERRKTLRNPLSHYKTKERGRGNKKKARKKGGGVW